MDNYGTHKLTARYEVLPAQEARELIRRIEPHFTPKHASWLNMVELERSIFARQCLKDKRVPSPDVLKDIALTYENRRNDKHAKVNWAFQIPHARDKLRHLYDKVFPW